MRCISICRRRLHRRLIHLNFTVADASRLQYTSMYVCIDLYDEWRLQNTFSWSSNSPAPGDVKQSRKRRESPCHAVRQFWSNHSYRPTSLRQRDEECWRLHALGWSCNRRISARLTSMSISIVTLIRFAWETRTGPETDCLGAVTAAEQIIPDSKLERVTAAA
jgi:hypothetical protein